jgi:hypothetical protein
LARKEQGRRAVRYPPLLAVLWNGGRILVLHIPRTVIRMPKPYHLHKVTRTSGKARSQYRMTTKTLQNRWGHDTALSGTLRASVSRHPIEVACELIYWSRMRYNCTI